MRCQTPREALTCWALVMIQKHNRSAAVILSIAEYERLRGLNVAKFEAFCDGVSEAAQSRGLTEETLEDLLTED